MQSAVQRAPFRRALQGGGAFLAVPSAYPNASPAVRDSIKLESRPVIAQDERVSLSLFTDRVLIDLGAVDPAAFEPETILADCEVVRQAISRRPEGVREILEGLRSNSVEGIERADRAAREMGLTEETAQAAGGGLFFLVVVVVAAAATSGCVKRGTKAGDQLTTPGHGVGGNPSGGGDAGPQDGGPGGQDGGQPQ